MMKADAWLLQEFDEKGNIVWSSIMPIRPKELSWFKDLPSKKHNIVLTPMYADHSQAEKFILGLYKSSILERNVGYTLV